MSIGPCHSRLDRGERRAHGGVLHGGATADEVLFFGAFNRLDLIEQVRQSACWKNGSSADNRPARMTSAFRGLRLASDLYLPARPAANGGMCTQFHLARRAGLG
jgi:hypothetical protein